MARQLRIEYAGAFYHITSRGNERRQIFGGDADREEFKLILQRTKERYAYLLHAYVLMDNHYHLLVETPHANIKQAMQNINTSYTVYANRKHMRVGHLFQGRYKAFIIDKENYLLELSRYIHLNPVRAGMVEMPEDYLWSSYRDYLSGDRKGALADTDDTLFLFSKRRTAAAGKYREFVNAGVDRESPIKEAVGSIVGSEGFREHVFNYVNRGADKAEIPDIKKIEKRHNMSEIVKRVAGHCGVDEDALLKRRKSTEKQRKIAIYLCRLLSGEKNAAIGRTFGITIQGVTNTVRRLGKSLETDKCLEKEIAELKRRIQSV